MARLLRLQHVVKLSRRLGDEGRRSQAARALVAAKGGDGAALARQGVPALAWRQATRASGAREETGMVLSRNAHPLRRGSHRNGLAILARAP